MVCCHVYKVESVTMFHTKVQNQNSIAADSMNTNADNYNNICYFVVLIEHLRLICPFINCMVLQTYTY